MKVIALELPTFGFVVATRAMIGVGIGLLVAERIPTPQRRMTGALLLTVGALATIPAIAAIRRSFDGRRRGGIAGSVERDEHFVGAHRYPRKGDDDFI